MLHVCIPVAICVGLCRCAAVKAWAWRHWTFWSVASAGADKRKRKEERQCYNLQGMGTFSHRYMGGLCKLCAAAVESQCRAAMWSLVVCASTCMCLHQTCLD